MPNITTNHAITYTKFSPTVYCLKALEQAIRFKLNNSQNTADENSSKQFFKIKLALLC